jgi:hypothetical protein
VTVKGKEVPVKIYGLDDPGTHSIGGFPYGDVHEPVRASR